MTTHATDDLPGASPIRLALFALALAAVCATVFAPVLASDFLRFDDNIHIYDNPYLNPVSWRNVGHFWRHPYEGLYIPVSYSIYSLISLLAHRGTPIAHSIAGWSHLSPQVFHGTCLLVHGLNALLAFGLLRRLFRNDFAAFAGALLFAIHPLQVESVAWISELRGLVAGAFALSALHVFFAAFNAERTDGGVPTRLPLLALSTLLYLLTLLSKPSTVSLPFVALAIGTIGFGLSSRKLIPALAVWTAIGAIFVIVTRNAQPVAPSAVTPLWTRAIIAGHSLAFYAAKTVWPTHLGLDYGQTPAVVLAHIGSYLMTAAVAVSLAIAWKLRARAPWLTLGMFVFALFLLPEAGLVPFAFESFSSVADRYAYLAMLGPAILVAGGWNAVAKVQLPRLTLAAGAATSCAILLLGMQSAVQVNYWHDDYALFSHALDVNPQSAMSETGIGLALDDAGHPREAEQHLRRAVALDPRFGQAWYNLGNVLQHESKFDEAKASYAQALEADPGRFEALYNLGLVQEKTGDTRDAIRCYRGVITMEPDMALVHEQLGLALAKANDLPDALAECRTALRLNPRSERARAFLANPTVAPSPNPPRVWLGS